MQNIDIKLKPSKWFICVLALLLVGSVLIILSLPLSGGYKSLLLASTLAYGSWILWVAGFMQSTHSMIGLQLLAEGRCNIHYPLYTIAAKIKGDSTVTTALCVLRFIIPGQRWARSCVIVKDSLDAESYRQLLVWLRCL